MENFTFYAPTYFAFGKDTENDTGKYVKRFGGSRVLLHYGGGSVIRSGLLDRVKKSLDGEGISYVELGGVKPNPRSGLVYEGIDLCRKEKVDFVLAVGGGSTIDSAKAMRQVQYTMEISGIIMKESSSRKHFRSEQLLRFQLQEVKDHRTLLLQKKKECSKEGQPEKHSVRNSRL